MLTRDALRHDAGILIRSGARCDMLPQCDVLLRRVGMGLEMSYLLLGAIHVSDGSAGMALVLLSYLVLGTMRASGSGEVARHGALLSCKVLVAMHVS